MSDLLDILGVGTASLGVGVDTASLALAEHEPGNQADNRQGAQGSADGDAGNGGRGETAAARARAGAGGALVAVSGAGSGGGGVELVGRDVEAGRLHIEGVELDKHLKER